MYKKLSIRLLRELFVLFIAGTIIGLLHQHDTILAGILATVTLFKWWRIYRQNPSIQRAIILLTGILLTGFFGALVEWWGINNGYWEYHDLIGNRNFANWLPFAWMLAFLYLYSIEEYFMEQMDLSALKDKLLLTAILSVILPTWGEIVAINLGVWTYYWNYQFFGVPLLAILLLMIFHISIFLSFSIVCRKYQIEDSVFGMKNS